MTKRTLQIATLSFTALIGTLVLLATLIWQVEAAGKKLHEYTQIRETKNEQEAAYLRVSRLVQETEEEREFLQKAFLTDEGEMIPLLNEIESFAAAVGMSIKIVDFNKLVNKEQGDSLTLTFMYTGSYTQLLLFTRMFEHLPYHSTITGLTLQKTSLDSWEGKLTILVSLKPL